MCSSVRPPCSPASRVRCILDLIRSEVSGSANSLVQCPRLHNCEDRKWINSVSITPLPLEQRPPSSARTYVHIRGLGLGPNPNPNPTGAIVQVFRTLTGKCPNLRRHVHSSYQRNGLFLDVWVMKDQHEEQFWNLWIPPESSLLLLLVNN